MMQIRTFVLALAVAAAFSLPGVAQAPVPTLPYDHPTALQLADHLAELINEGQPAAAQVAA